MPERSEYTNDWFRLHLPPPKNYLEVCTKWFEKKKRRKEEYNRKCRRIKITAWSWLIQYEGMPTKNEE